jgi:peptide/nickel transport system substrate-binding protein
MPLRRGVKWHDGRPFTAKDVKCTWDLLAGRGNDRLRINPRKSWYDNLDSVTADGDFEVTFHLNRPQPSFLTLLASGWSPVYPCHVPARDMRLHPIGTGPFKFVEFKPNVSITLARNPDYWKPERPYLDGIEWTVVKDVSTRLLSFIAGQADVYFGVTIPQLQDVKREVPEAICENYLVNGSRNLIVNRRAPPFDKPELRRAMSLTLDRQAFVDIIGQGQGAIGGPMEPPPEGLWGMPAEMLTALSGARVRQEALARDGKPGSSPAVEQPRVELYLQAGDASRERGLRDVTALGRDGEARRAGHGQEIAEERQIHKSRI